MRVLVCGGRNFDDIASVHRSLNALAILGPIDVLIHGDASGADRLAATWAKMRGIPIEAYPADWKNRGKGAGPFRNAQMMKDGKPDIVVAFPGGGGTADMVRRAKLSGVPVLEPPANVHSD